ncbi:sugar phosphate isomerase [Spirochaetia bacterium]|nr:sugar phosphate isomerase [Spirochaetia bacterium]
MIGLTSITFRSLRAERIIALAKEAGLEGIEWGADVHVPPGDTGLAGRIKAQTEEAGLSVLSYGSYYRLLEGDDFLPVLETACALHAPLIRIWAGTKGSAQADDDYYRRAAGELQQVCALAADRHVRIGLEYHRQTLTDTAGSALRLIDLTNQDNLTSYWQPNPDLSPSEHFREISLLLPRLSSVHVFQWEKGNVRRPLAEGKSVWKEYIRLLGTGRNYIMEFVRDDREENFLADAAVLRELIRNGNNTIP